MIVSPFIDQSRGGNIAISLGPRFSGETERIGKIAMSISVLRLHAIDGMMIGWRGVSISRDVVYHRVSIWSRGLMGGAGENVNTKKGKKR